MDCLDGANGNQMSNTASLNPIISDMTNAKAKKSTYFPMPAKESSVFIRVHPCPGFWVASLAIALSLGAQAQLRPSQPEPPSGWTPKKLATAKKYMVAAGHPLAVEAGLAMLDKGGSAVDAAIATQLVLGLVEPQASGLGGGAFFLHFDARAKRVSAIDGRETAPAASTPGMMLKADGKHMLPLVAVETSAGSAAHLTKYANVTDSPTAQNRASTGCSSPPSESGSCAGRPAEARACISLEIGSSCFATAF